MSDFQNKLIKYINKNYQNPDASPHFKYGETTYIEPEIAFEIANVFQQLNVLQNMWEKEKDYNRLLRKENQELSEELDYCYEQDNVDEDENDSLLNNNGEKEYLS